MDTFTVFSIEKAQQLPGVLLWHTAKLWQQSLNIALKSVNLSSTNAVILSNLLHLSLEHKRVTQVEIAKLSGVDLMTTSVALRSLERKGFVKRRVILRDKRANQLTLTSLGKRTAFAALKIIAETHQRFFQIIATEGSTQTFVDNLKRLLEKNKKKEVIHT